MNLHVYILPTLRKLTASLLLLAFTAGIAFAAAGKVQFTIGDVKIQDGKQAVRIPKKGDEINAGDTLITGGNGSLQVTLADGGLLAVRPNTQMRIDDYAYSGKADDKNNKSVFSLAKGTFRSITGAIGQNNKEGYRVNTPGATMGIRGTDHEPAVVLPLPPGQLPQTPLQAAPPGTYDRVNSGQTFIQTPDGLVTINPNQVGFAPVGGAPTILPNVPSFYSSAPKPGAAKKVATAGTQSGSTGGTGSTSSSSGTSSSTDASASTSTTESSTSTSSTASTSSTSTGTTDTGTLGTLGATDTNTLSTASTGGSSVSTNTAITTDTMITSVTGTSAGTTSSSTGGPAPFGSGVVGANITMGGTGGGGTGSIYLDVVPPTKDIFLGPQNELLYATDLTSVDQNGMPSPFEFVSSGNTSASTLLDKNSYAFSDLMTVVDWGRWAQTEYGVTEGGVPQISIGDFHYAYSNNITPASFFASGVLTGTIPYSLVTTGGGATTPTDLVGGLATLNSALLNVNFSTQMVDLTINATVSGSIVLSGTASGSITAFTGPAGILPLTGDPVKASGLFVGPTAIGAITSYDIRSPGGTIGAIGVAVFERPPQ